ncbi:type VII secretion-associated serine protease mycosin [Streptomyces sp. WMMB 714]|uniref:S8 family serine peptidase n=1 Tax=Streptomyces sp. WMMB 714 TaxID=1286822 RepID=UPI0005F86527|nr:S8 family serine peptidase [Streptomyces sp. WMMB 714]SCK56666.1 type VII secretion-associated serine protease mycosin [Streptomyces sp. WMMB 714]
MGKRPTLRVIGSTAIAGVLIFAASPQAVADDVRDKQWALDALDAESVWKVTRGKGQTIAVIDDGVNAQHPDLKGNVLKGKDFVDGGSPAPERGDSHGTGMAAMIAGHGHGPGNANGIMGLAPAAKILPIRVTGGKLDDSIKYAVDHGASVINISLGDDSENSDDDDEAITYALKKDVPVFASTGNSGGAVEYPAAYPGVVPVGGVKQDGTLWEKSNKGPETLLVGPATRVLTAGGEDSNYYAYGTGTSDATAYASATAALIRAKYPDLAAGQVVNRLAKTAKMPASEKGAKVPDERYGYGAISPLAALQEDIPKGPKYGPLSLPLEIKNEVEAAKQLKEDKALEEKQDREFVILWTITGVLAFLFVGAIVLTIVLVRRRRRNRNSGPGGPGAPGGYSYSPNQAPGYGMPSQQQQLYTPESTAPPQQPPYN